MDCQLNAPADGSAHPGPWNHPVWILVFLGLAFMSIAGVFSVHGLLTPGHIEDEFYPVLSISSWLSVFVGAFFVALSASSLPEGVGSVDGAPAVDPC